MTLPGIWLNEDNSHFFFTRAGQRLDETTVNALVDQYAGTQVTHLLLCPNCMRASYASDVWDPIWRDYDPTGPDDQPLLASLSPEARTGARGWIHTAWALHQAGIDPYARWIERARHHGISPWLSMRMNDVHNVDDERCYIHSEFWRGNPQLRRVTHGKFSAWVDRAFDYGQAEVREHHLRLIHELAERYDFDGLELDWMRFGFHFRPGYESAGAGVLTEFTAEVRRLLDDWEQRRGHRIQLSARVPSRPATSAGMGMDAVTWARRSLVDALVITPFWASAETDMPIELWKQLLDGTGVTLHAGLEVLLRPSPDWPLYQTNSLETARGAAASFLDRGSDGLYLFNYMDSQTCIDDLENYPALLRECGDLATLAGKARRHVMTFADTWVPGEPRAQQLPAVVAADGWQAFRLHIGPQPTAQAFVQLGADRPPYEVRVNGELCIPTGESTFKPGPEAPLSLYAIPSTAIHAAHNVIEVHAGEAMTVVWIEVAVAAST